MAFTLHRPKLNLKRTLSFVSSLLVFVIFAVVAAKWLAHPPQAAWFDDNYAYRQRISFTHNADISSDRRVSVSLDTATLITASKMQSTCKDTRFTDINGKLLRYQLTGTCNNAATTYDVVFPIIVNGSNTGYVYYGNPAAGSASEDVSAITSLSPSGGSPAFATEELGQGPVTYWRFDEGYGTTANDASSLADNGTLGGTTIPTWQTEDQCLTGKCLYFDGSSSKVTGSVVVKAMKTISFWVRPNTIASQGLVNLDGGTHKISTNSSGVVSATGFTSPTYYLNGLAVTTLTLAQNQWNLVTITTGTSFDTTSSWTLGTDGTNFQKGFFDEVKIYNYARSAAQVKTSYISRGTSKGAGAALGASADNNFALSNGLVGYWKMDESSWNGTTNEVLDSSGNALHGTAGNGVTTTKGKFNNGGNFDGSNDFVGINDNALLQTSADMTLSVWAKFNTISSANDHKIIYKNHATSPFLGYELSIQTNTNFFFQWVNTSGTYYYAYNSLVPATSTWYHLVGVKSGNVLKLYVNTVNDPTLDAAPTGTLFNSKQSLYIGSNNGTNATDGIIDEARLYNRALSSAEVTQLYNWGPGPVANWKMDENTGTTTNDSSTNANTGTLSGSTKPTWTPGKFGSALNFDGITAYVAAGNGTSVQVTGPLTLTAWINITSTGTRTVISKWNTTGNQRAYQLVISGGNLQFLVSPDGTNNNGVTTAGTTTLVTGKWYHVAAVYIPSTSVTLYVNGVVDAVNTTSIPASAFNSTADAELGAITSGGQNLFAGVIDNARIYNYSLTSKQIIEDLNGGHPTGGSPMGTQLLYWKFDEQSGSGASTVNNSIDTQSAITGNLTGATWNLENGTVNCKLNGCLSFSTSTNNVSAGNITALDSISAFSLSFWINPTSLAVNSAIISKSDFSTKTLFAVNTDSTTNSELRVYIANATNDTGSNYLTTSGLGLTNSTWAHIAVVYDGTLSAANRVKVYKNGRLVSGSATGTIPTTTTANTTSNLKVGASDSGTYTALNAYLDEVKIYLSPLTPSEILVDANAGSAAALGGVLGTHNDEGFSLTPPVAWWKLDENTTKPNNSATIVDSSGNGNTATARNGPISAVPGKIGGAYTFATNQRMDTTDNTILKITGAVSLSAWIQIGDTTTVEGLLGKFNTGQRQYSLGANSTTAGKIDFNVTSNCNTIIKTTSNTILSTSTWYHIVGVYIPSTSLTLYVNGLKDAQNTTSIPASLCDGTAGAAIGALGSGGSSPCNCKVDDARIYNYALSAAQADYIYNRSAPVIWYKFDECQGTTAYNSAVSGSGSAAGNNGTITIGGTGTYTSPGTCPSGTATEAWSHGSDKGAGKRNYALGLDGTDDFVSTSAFSPLAASGLTTSTVSWGGWFYPITSAASKTLIEKASEFQLTTDSNSKPVCGIYYSAAFNNATAAPNALNLSAWNHVICTYDGVNISTYVNGLLVATTANTNAITAASSILYIGQTSGGANFFQGLVDSTLVYNYALTAAQVKRVYNNGAVFFGPTTGSP